MPKILQPTYHAISKRRRPPLIKRSRVLAISSGGGHWVQLLRLRPAFEKCDTTYVTVDQGYKSEVKGDKFTTVIDSNRDTKLKLILSFFSIAWTIIRVRPNTIITTGAAPGFFAIFIGKLLRRKTIWLDSIANAEELSMSGQKAGKYADRWLTQWEHLATPKGPYYCGNVLGEASEGCSQNSENSENKTKLRRKHDTTNQRKEATDFKPQTSEFQSQKSFKIFVTVGTDQPFDRMVKAIDEWASNNSSQDIFAQIGETTYKPKNFVSSSFLTPLEFKEKTQRASLIIGHAGMGTILTALEYRKPILIMPKLASLGEHRNEHQSATAKYLLQQGKANVAFDAHELMATLDNLKSIAINNSIGPYASNPLITELSSFIEFR